MRKVAFIHATLNLKNSIHQHSLILEQVPRGAFSIDRPLDQDATETILDGIIEDMLFSKELAEVIVVTSDAPCDKAVIGICERYNDRKIPVRACVIKRSEEYSIVQGNMTFNEAEWPYVGLPAYGAWHMHGFSTLAAQYNADIALIVQADSSFFFDAVMFDQLMQKYTVKGIWGKVSDFVQTEFALLNVKFMNDVGKRYERKIKEMHARNENNRFFRVDKALLLYHEDSNHGDLFISFDRSTAPLQSVFCREDLEKSLLLVKADFERIEALMEQKCFMPVLNTPTFLDVELVTEDGRELDLETFKALLNDGENSVWAMNLLVRNKTKGSLIDHLACARDRCGMLMLEFDNKSVNGLSGDKIRPYVQYVDLFQFNIDPSVKNDIVTDIIETLNREKKDGKPFIVLRTSPQDIDKYSTYKLLVDKVVIKSSSGKQEPDGTIDFAPIDRGVCKKLSTSFFINVNKGVAPCRYMKEQDVLTGRISDHFTGSSFQTLRHAHTTKDFSKYEDCRACKEWYIPDIVQKLPRTLCFSVKKGVVFPQKKAYDKAQALKQFNTISRVRAQILKSVENIAQQQGYDARSKHSSYDLAWDLARAINRVFIDLGGILFSAGEHEKALDAWEYVLQLDPSNERIHTILDRLLQNQVTISQ
jgi:hypothetical protein